MIDGEREDGDCDEMQLQDEVNQEESEQNEVDGTKKEGRRCQLFYSVKQHAWLLLCANWHSCSCQQVDRRKNTSINPFDHVQQL